MAKASVKESKKPPYVGIVGMGYVGLPLAREFIIRGAKVIGFDINEKNVKRLNAGQSPLKHIPSSDIADMVKSGRFVTTTNMTLMSKPDALIICVPTPLTENREPDMTYIVITCETIAKYLRKGQLVSLESTTYPGTTSCPLRRYFKRAG